MAAVSPAQPLPIMTTLCIQMLLGILDSLPCPADTTRAVLYRSAGRTAKLVKSHCPPAIDPGQYRVYIADWICQARLLVTESKRKTELWIRVIPLGSTRSRKTLHPRCASKQLKPSRRRPRNCAPRQKD